MGVLEENTRISFFNIYFSESFVKTKTKTVYNCMRTRVQNKSAQNGTFWFALHKKGLGSQLPKEDFDQNSLSFSNCLCQ